jgi:hypothetical protein
MQLLIMTTVAMQSKARNNLNSQKMESLILISFAAGLYILTVLRWRSPLHHIDFMKIQIPAQRVIPESKHTSLHN